MRKYIKNNYGIIISIFFIIISVPTVILYLYDKTVLYHNALVAHFGVAFFEIGITILIIEEFLKPRNDSIERAKIAYKKKQEFLRKLELQDFDQLLYDAMIQFERLLDSTITYTNEMRIDYIKQHTEAIMRFETMRPESNNLLIHNTNSTLKSINYTFYESLEMVLHEDIENILHLGGRTQYTDYHSWDAILELYIELKKQTHSIAYMRLPLTDSQVFMRLYSKCMYAFSALLLDMDAYKIPLKDTHLQTDDNILWAKSVINTLPDMKNNYEVEVL